MLTKIIFRGPLKSNRIIDNKLKRYLRFNERFRNLQTENKRKMAFCSGFKIPINKRLNVEDPLLEIKTIRCFSFEANSALLKIFPDCNLREEKRQK